MDAKKCAALKAELKVQLEPQVVRAERFFEGNDDTGSIGCNLSEHPGITSFQTILTGLESRSDVQAVYTQITELDPGEDQLSQRSTALLCMSFGGIDRHSAGSNYTLATASTSCSAARIRICQLPIPANSSSSGAPCI
jgi:hypothetical protein